MRLIRMDQLMCKHEWVLIERPRHIKYDYMVAKLWLVNVGVRNVRRLRIGRWLDIRLEIYLRKLIHKLWVLRGGRMKVKKLLIGFLILGLVLSFAGCGDKVINDSG